MAEQTMSFLCEALISGSVCFWLKLLFTKCSEYVPQIEQRDMLNPLVKKFLSA